MKTSKQGVIIFDGDDTLWRTQELYDSAKAQFEKLMKTQGFTEGNLIELLDELDAERVALAQFSKTRFLESMLITYALLCGKHSKTWVLPVESKIKQIGSSIFTFPPKLYEDAVRTLEILSKYFSLILFTNGDEKIQREKIDSLGEKFKSHFLRIYIPMTKTEQEYKTIVDDLHMPIKKIWVVGNSMKSDINPALKLDFNTILIPRGVWRYEESKSLSGNVLVAHSLEEAGKIIREKEKQKSVREEVAHEE